MIQRAYIQELGSGKLGKEETMVAGELDRRGIPYSLFTKKRIYRRQLDLDRTCLVAGEVDSISGALKQLEIDQPTTDSYPDSLKPFLHRRIWKSTVGNLQQGFFNGTMAPVFAKPHLREKRFTGRVFSEPGDFFFLGGVSKREPVICAEVVEWISEFRVYVVNSEIRAIAHYVGDAEAAPDRQILEQAVTLLDQAGQSVAGYALDFGVLSSGETALVERNDGFALGAYEGLEAKDYADLVIARWTELLES